MFLGLLEDESRIWFGGYDRSMIIQYALRNDPEGTYEAMTDSELDNLIEWFPLSYVAYWSTPLKKVTLDGIDIDTRMENLIFDSGSSLNHVPVADFNTIINTITRNHEC